MKRQVLRDFAARAALFTLAMLLAIGLTLGLSAVWAAPAAAQSLNLDLGGGGDGASTARIIQLLALLTVLSLAPAIVIMVTAFTRNRRFATGEIIRKDDIEWVVLRGEQSNRQGIVEVDRLVGQEVRRGLNAGQQVRASDLRTPLAVAKNAVVTMKLQTPRMQLTSKGKALEDGSVGDTVRIMNTQSKTVIEGVVTSMNTVLITSTAPISN